MACSAIYVASTGGVSVASGGTVPLGSVVRRKGCQLALSGDGIVASGTGWYDVVGNVTVSSNAALVVTVALLEDGLPVQGATATVNVAAVGEGNVTVPAIVRNACCGTSKTLTLRVTTSTGDPVTVENAALTVVGI